MECKVYSEARGGGRKRLIPLRQGLSLNPELIVLG